MELDTSATPPIKMARSGLYDKILINKWLQTATGGKIRSRLRPDLAGLRKTGTIDLVEVPHPGQTVHEMQDKIANMEDLLDVLAGPDSFVTPPVPK